MHVTVPLKPLLPRECAYCETTFTPGHARTIYCKPACATGAMRERRRSKKSRLEGRTLTCDTCEQEVEMRFANQRFCSPRCRERGSNAHGRGAKRQATKISQKTNDLRQLRALLGGLQADAKQYATLRGEYPQLPESVFQGAQDGLSEAISVMTGTKTKFHKEL